jgi:putative aldouronate transport system permease protein
MESLFFRSRNTGEIIFDVCNTVFLTLLALLALFPFWNVIVVSISSYEEYIQNPFLLFPKAPTLGAYEFIFATGQVTRAMAITVLITVVGTALNMFVSISLAWVMSNKDLPGRNAILTLVIITMFFSGGLIPYYLQVRRLGLYNSVLALMLPVAINTWYMIIMKNFFHTIPASLEESARIDGANDITILARIVVPLSMPMIATFILFYSVDRWNEWWHATLFITDPQKFPLQRVLREYIVNRALNFNDLGEERQASLNMTLEGVKTAIIVIATVPLTVVYPFLQRYFTQGVIVGAIKS